MTGPHDFSDRPFVAGTLTGIRAYRVAEDGSLTGIHFEQPVVHGENVATCRSNTRAMHRAGVQMRSAIRQLYGLPPVTSEPEEHQLLTLLCTCGFYAYFDGSSTYMSTFGSRPDQPKVEAIVEGYGKVVVGSRGFRCEKLRLVALVRTDDEAPTHQRLDRLAHYLGARRRLSVNLVSVGITGALWATVAALAASPWWWVAAVLSGAFAYTVLRLYRRGWQRAMEERLRALFGRSPAPTADDWQRIREQYPDVPIYKSREAAMAAHPLTVPDAP